MANGAAEQWTEDAPLWRALGYTFLSNERRILYKIYDSKKWLLTDLRSNDVIFLACILGYRLLSRFCGCAPTSVPLDEIWESGTCLTVSAWTDSWRAWISVCTVQAPEPKLAWMAGTSLPTQKTERLPSCYTFLFIPLRILQRIYNNEKCLLVKLRFKWYTFHSMHPRLPCNGCCKFFALMCQPKFHCVPGWTMRLKGRYPEF